MGGWFLFRQGWEHLFGNLVAGTGVALLAIAAFVQLGAPAVPVAWAAEAVALAWLAVRRRHRWSAGAALILGGMAIAHLVVVEYPLWEAGIPAAMTFEPPLLNPEGGSLLAVLLALGVTAGLVPVRWIRSVLAAIGVLLVAYAATFSATGPALAAALVLTGLAGLLLDRLVDRLPTADGLQPVSGWTGFGWSASAAAVVAGLMAVVLLFSTEFPPQDLGTVAASPFLNPACLSLAVVLAGLVAAGVLVPVRWLRSGFAGLGILLTAWALAFQVTGVDLVALLAVLLPAGVILDRGLARLPDDERFAAMSGLVPFELSATAGGAVAWMASALYAVATFLDPTGWGQVTPPSPPFSDERALVAALLAGTALAAARWLAPMALRRIAVIAAIVTAAWVVPFEVYADMVVVLWVALAVAALAATRWDRRGGIAYAGLASILWIGGAGVAFGIVARPDRLWVVDTSARGARAAPRPVAARVRCPRPRGVPGPAPPRVRRVAGVARGDVRDRARVRGVHRGRRPLPAPGRWLDGRGGAGQAGTDRPHRHLDADRRGDPGHRARPAPPDASTRGLRPPRARGRQGRPHRHGVHGRGLPGRGPGRRRAAAPGLAPTCGRTSADRAPASPGSREDRTRLPDRDRSRGVVAGPRRHDSSAARPGPVH